MTVQAKGALVNDMCQACFSRFVTIIRVFSRFFTISHDLSNKCCHYMVEDVLMLALADLSLMRVVWNA